MSEFAPDPEVITALYFMLALPGYHTRVAWSRAPGEPLDRGLHIDVGVSGYSRQLFLDTVMMKAADRDVVISAGLRRREGFGTCDRARCLWARVEGKKDAQALLKFRPVPSMVLREGSTSRLVALWELERPLNYEWVLRANKRIAHKLFAPKKWTDLEFVFPAPGSCLRADRARPVPVRVESWSGRVYTPRAIVGGLKEAPDPAAWREAA